MKIAILGAGVAGLATAIALRLKGIDVAVYEKSLSGNHRGAGIVCWPNASFVLDQLGLLEHIAAVSGQPQAMRRFSSAGEALGSLDISRLNELMGYPSYSILRRDLMALLESRATGLGVLIRYGCGVKRILSERCGKAVVELENGTRLAPDLIIGADGRMGSMARAFVHGDNRALFQGFINWVGVFESNHSVFDEISVSDYWGVGERFGIVPVSSKRAYWAAAAYAPEVGASDPATYHQSLRATFGAWPDPIAEIISDTPLGSIHKIYLHDHNPIDDWHRENVLLIGDAAHAPLPTSGQGACQALEDAWYLAALLEHDVKSLPALFNQFTVQRGPKTAGITRGARQLASSLFNRDAEYCRQRNQKSKATDYNLMVEGMARGWSRGLPLQE